MLRGQGEQAGSKRSKESKLGGREASWGLPEVPGRFQGCSDAQGARGASWEQGEQAGGFLRLQEGSRDSGMLRG